MLVKNDLDSIVYHQPHQMTLHRTTRRKRRIAELLHDPIKSPVISQQKKWNSDVMYPCYTFDRVHTVHLHDRFYKW